MKWTHIESFCFFIGIFVISSCFLFLSAKSTYEKHLQKSTNHNKKDKQKIISKVIVLLILFIFYIIYENYQTHMSILKWILLSFAVVSCSIFAVETVSIIRFINKEPLSCKKAAPDALCPDQYFSTIFKDSNGIIDDRLIELRKEFFSVVDIRSTEDPVSFITCCMHELYNEYKNYIGNYLNRLSDDAKKTEINSLQNKIKLVRELISFERECFLTDNGETAESFIFNRQNYFTDIFLTAIMIPLFIKLIDIQTQGIADIVSTICNNVIMFAMSLAFFVIVFYRIYKYNKNKRSMLKSHLRVNCYNKANELVSIFEHALNDVAGIKPE